MPASSHRYWAAVALRGALFTLIATTLAACGPKPLQIRRASVGTCSTEASSGQDPLLGWVSIASADRIVAAVDRISARAGWLAKGASFRDKIRELMDASAKKSGITSAAWYDWSRPLHALVQHAAAKPAEGLSVVLPITSPSDVRRAYAKLEVPADEGASAAFRMKGSKTRAQVAFPHPQTMVMAPSAERLQRAMAVARCAQVRAPDALLQFGVRVAEVARHHGPLLNELLDEIERDAKRPAGIRKALRPYRASIERLVHGAERVELGLRDANDDVMIDVSVFPVAGSELAASLDRLSGYGPSPLVRRLPASSWLASVGVRDLEDLEIQIDDALGQLSELFHVPEPATAALRELMVETTALSGAHSAAALHFDDELPIALTALMRSSDPERLLATLRDGSWAVARAMAPDLDPNDPATPPWVKLLQGANWSAPLTVLARKLDGSGLTLKWSTVKRDGLSCELLRLDVDSSKLGATNPMLARAAAMVDDGVEAALCAASSDLLLTFGHDAVALAKAAAADRPDNITTTGWYRRRVGKAPPQTLFALQPTPILDLARSFLPKVPEWPEDEAVTMICATRPSDAACTLAIPAVAIATAVRGVMPGSR